MAQALGVRIRELDQATFVDNDDVLIIDRVDATGSSVTYQIRYDDFRNYLFTGDIIIGGDLEVEGDINLVGNINLSLRLNDLFDVNTSGVRPGDSLVFDGVHWIPAVVNTGGGGGGGSNTDSRYILFESGTSEVIFSVTHGLKTAANQFNGHGNVNCFYINGIEAPNLMLPANRTFVFEQDDASSAVYPIDFYSWVSNDSIFTPPIEDKYGFVREGTPGNGWRVKVTFTNIFESGYIKEQTPSKIFYHSSGNQTGGHDYMGNTINMVAQSVFDTGIDGGGGIGLPFIAQKLMELDGQVQTLMGN